MTAVIGILNKNGISMAADSAITVTGGNRKKIYNTANKIFTLSKFHPISIMIYSSSSFMQTPWEIIIKLYRKQLEKNSFQTVKEYKDDFIVFLRNNQFFTTEEGQIENLKNFSYWNLSNLKDKIIDQLENDKTEEELADDFVNFLLADLNANIATYTEHDIVLTDFHDYTLENFKDYATVSLKEVIDLVFEGIEINDNIINAIHELYYKHLRTINFIGPETGLVFGGFGENEIYPAMHAVKISEVFDNRLRFKDDLSAIISDKNNGAILPFAQTDVINMFIKGIDPEIENTYVSVFEKLLSKYNTTIHDLINPQLPGLALAISQIDLKEIIKEYILELNNVKRENQIIPTIDTVSILSKEDLAEMAESLIYLTYLKRRISSSEESVGGPIDVAIISKGDGFIWKKRKHYFNSELNKHFMANYFNQ